MMDEDLDFEELDDDEVGVVVGGYFEVFVLCILEFFVFVKVGGK